MYMYIRRDSSNIGRYAAWIEARLYVPRDLRLRYSSRRELAAARA